MRTGILVALLLGFSLPPRPVLAQSDDIQEAGQPLRLVTTLRDRPALTGGEPETVWVGHVVSATGLPGQAGGYGPYHVGRGPNRAGVTPNGIWTWDHFQAGETDSLQGWWPIRIPYRLAGGWSKSDRDRSWWAIDYGNQLSYVINQGRSSRRSFGVVGAWHRDPCNQAPGSVDWAPIAGSASAWCGLRAHGDLSVLDERSVGGTGNPFNEDAVQFNSINSTSPGGTDSDFPGYGGQWDQLLYREFTITPGQALEIKFMCQMNLSEDKDTRPASRTGWFDQDYYSAPTPNDGQFISSSDAGDSAPIDSFMVYLGVPPDTNNCVGSDGVGRVRYDPQYDLVNEVTRQIQQQGLDLLYLTANIGKGGSPGGAPFEFHITIPWSAIEGLFNLFSGNPPPSNDKLVLVNRLKTNNCGDSQDGHFKEPGQLPSGRITTGSGLRGVMIDDVQYRSGSGSWTMLGDFEGPGAIDNRPSVPPSAAWKSTARPPAVYFHTHNLSDLPFNDPCGPAGSANRICNMQGRVISVGNHDRFEQPGEAYGLPEQEVADGMVSPTINLCSSGPGDFNAMGIDASIAASDDYVIAFDLHGAVDPLEFGSSIIYGLQSYPATAPGSTVPRWGTLQIPRYQFYKPDPGCVHVELGTREPGLLRTSNPSQVPDSIRVFIGHVQQCFRFQVSAADCGPSHQGIYFDNLSVGFAGSSQLKVTSTPGLEDRPFVQTFDWYNDTFTWNQAIDPTNAAFDTCAALLKTARNLAYREPQGRPIVPGDTMVAWTHPRNIARYDLVFRILPGVGNYVVIGNRASGVARRPDTMPRVAALPGDATNGNLTPVDRFWGAYMADNGAYGTGGNGTNAPGHTNGVWDPNRWNSARCDSAEVNIFPVQACGNISGITTAFFASMYHESDPKYAVLGIVKNRCFLKNPTVMPIHTNITCGDPNPQYPPAWTSNAGTGFDPNEVPGLPGRTREFTKIIPDGQLTPGAHVQYFFRLSKIGAPLNEFAIIPDTNVVDPQPGNDRDGRRWRQFSVLPDRWKNPAWGGAGLPCMLYLDLADGRGDERRWVSIADSIGMTAAPRRGAHNGWAAAGNVDVNDPAGFVRAHGGQPGTLWDLYQVTGAEGVGTRAGTLGSRAATHSGLIDGKQSFQGPTLAMLRAFYRVLVIETGDLQIGVLGPHVGESQDDVGILTDFMTNPVGGGTPRGVMVQGSGFAQSLTHDGQESFLAGQFGVGLRSGDYTVLSGDQSPVSDLVAQPGFGGGIYGVRSGCGRSNDVLEITESGPVAASFYENAGSSGPYLAGANWPEGGSRLVRTLIDGFGIQSIGSSVTLRTQGGRDYVLQMLTNLFSGMNCPAQGTPVGIGEQPGAAEVARSLIELRSQNPAHGADVRMAIQLPRTERATVTVYDIGGRIVKTVADRVFIGRTEHVVTWDGTDVRGDPVAPGVYFYQVRSPSAVGRRTIVMLSR